MIIIGITGWTGIARFTRAEFLRIKSLEFVQASKSLGFSAVRTIFKHALPNALAPVFVSIAFGIASAILIVSIATVVIRFRRSKYLNIDKDKSNDL